MLKHAITGIFGTNAAAKDAVDELRRIGVADSQIAVLSRSDIDRAAHDDEAALENEAARDANSSLPSNGVPPYEEANREQHSLETAEEVGAGALFGLSAFAMPGSAPFLAAGFLPFALSANGTNKALGGAAHALHDRLTDAGYSEHVAHELSKAVERGAVAVSVDIARSVVPPDKVRTAITGSGGELLSEPNGAEMVL